MRTKLMRRVPALAALAALAFAGGQASAAVITQIGIAIDGSGSIGSADFSTQRSGLATAFGALPTDGTVEITVVQFASSAQLEIGPVVVDSVATRNTLVANTNAISQTGGGTVPGTALDLLTAQMTASANFDGGAVDSIINLSTDGGFSVSPAVAAAVSARAAGIDALTAEAIGPFAATDNLLDMVFNPTTAPNTGGGVLLATDASPPNPLTSAPWVVPISDFNAFGPVIDAKIQAIVAPPQVSEPGTAALLLLGGLLLLVTRRKARSSVASGAHLAAAAA